MKAFTKIFQFLIIISPIALFGWLFWQNFVPSGVFETVYNFERSPWVSAFRPGHRISEIQRQGDFVFQSVIDDPVYFDVNLPVNFEKIILEFDFRNSLNQPFKIGAFTSRDNWEFLIKDFEIINEMEGWKTGKVEFKTAYLDKPENKITFIISTPEIRKLGGSVDVREMRVVAMK